MTPFPRCDCGAVLSFTPIVRKCGDCEKREKVIEAAHRLIDGHYHGDGGNLMDAMRERREDGRLVAATLLDLLNKK